MGKLGQSDPEITSPTTESEVKVYPEETPETIPGASYYANHRIEAYFAVRDVAESEDSPEKMDIRYVLDYFLNDHRTYEHGAPEVISIFSPKELPLVEEFGRLLSDLAEENSWPPVEADFLDSPQWERIALSAARIAEEMRQYGVPPFEFSRAVWAPADGSMFH